MPRSSAFYLGLTLVGLLFLYRLFQVQVINDDYAARAERNATAGEKLYAPRGYVYDRDGRLLIGNSPAYDLSACVRVKLSCVATKWESMRIRTCRSIK